MLHLTLKNVNLLDRTRGNGLKLRQGGLDWILGKIFFTERVVRRWNSWVTIPGDVQKTCRCGTSGHGLAGTVVFGW